MKPFTFLVVVVVLLLADLTAPYPFSEESDDGDDDGGDGDENGDDRGGDEDDRGGDVDEAFLAGTNRTFTFGECSSYAGQPGQMELVTSRCGSPNVYYSSVITFRVTNPYSSSVNDNGCSGGGRVVVVPCVMTCIRALDVKEGGSGRANVTILQGGVGSDFIRVRVDGELRKGYYYLMQAYANCTLVNQRQVKY